jgi:hypothetical protein
VASAQAARGIAEASTGWLLVPPKGPQRPQRSRYLARRRRVSEVILLPAKTAADLEIDSTGAARDPRKAGSLRVEWAGVCGLCHRPIWASETPPKSELRRCLDCGGGKVFRYWLVPRRVPAESALLETARKGKDSRVREFATTDPIKSDGSSTVLRDAVPRIAGGRAGRPGRPRVGTAERIAQERERARRYRARQRERT